ncbi:hypothetical protein FPV67DRAFT_1532307 [Lyophyllum atratum]|nr:hypothetical protein FPV67DRAFT_1532307 [Lyophyllum atratum]
MTRRCERRDGGLVLRLWIWYSLCLGLRCMGGAAFLDLAKIELPLAAHRMCLLLRRMYAPRVIESWRIVGSSTWKM